MAEDKRLETIQDEIKLLKGELKQSLASVRDYLLNMELPSSEFSTILAALSTDGEQKITMKGSFTNPQDNAPRAEPQDELTETVSEDAGGESVEEESEMPGEDEDLIDVEGPLGKESERLTDDDLMGEEAGIAPEDELFSPQDAIEDEELGEPEELGELEELGKPEELGEPEELYEQDEPITPESEMSEEEQPVGNDKTIATANADADEMSSAIPKVNMLANLINWASRAKKEIGYDQLPVFLEVYGISGHLSQELKDVILHLSELTAERPEVANNAEVWSQLMLSLHGILTGGDAPLHPVIPFWSEASIAEEPAEEEIIEVDKPRGKKVPVKLKLVFPNGDGKSKEFCIDLNPEEDNDDSSSKRKN